MKITALKMACIAAAITFTACSDNSITTDDLNQRQTLTFVSEYPATTDTRGIVVDENYKIHPVWKGGIGGDYVRLHLSNHQNDLDVVDNQIFYASESLPDGSFKKATFKFSDVDLSDMNADFVALHVASGGSHGTACIIPLANFDEGTILFQEGENGQAEGVNEDNYDNSREILVSKPAKLSDLKTTGDNTLQFKRLSSLIHLHIKDPKHLVKMEDMWHWAVRFSLKSVEQEAEYRGFTGSLLYNMNTGEVKRVKSGRNDGIVMNVVTSQNNESDLHGYTQCMPTELLKGSHIRLELNFRPFWNTDLITTVTMVREVKENIKLESGVVNTFVFTIEEGEVQLPQQN